MNTPLLDGIKKQSGFRRLNRIETSINRLVNKLRKTSPGIGRERTPEIDALLSKIRGLEKAQTSAARKIYRRAASSPGYTRSIVDQNARRKVFDKGLELAREGSSRPNLITNPDSWLATVREFYP